MVLEERVATSHDEWPDFTSDADVVWYVDGLCDDIGTVVEVHDIICGSGVENSLDSSSVIGDTVTLSSLVLHGNERGSRNIGVLRLRLGEDSAISTEKTSGLGGGVGGTLDSLSGIDGLVFAALDPGVDLCVSGKESGRGASVLNGNWDVGRHIDVLNDQGAVGGALISVVNGCNSDRGVADLGVHDQHGANGLRRSTAVGHINADGTAVNLESVEGPCPVPVHEDGGLAVLELEVAAGELLGSEESTVLATVEGEVGHEATGAVIHEDTDLGEGVAAIGSHVENDVLETGGLGNLPVDTGTGSGGHRGQVDDEVADLAEEVVLVGEPVDASVSVRVCVNDGHADEASGGLQGWWLGEISDHLRVVVLGQWLADHVGSGGEVDETWGDSRGVTALAAAVAS